MGIHKYSPDTSSSQLSIKSLGTGVPRVDGHGPRHALLCVACFVLNILCDFVNNIHDGLYMEH